MIRKTALFTLFLLALCLPICAQTVDAESDTKEFFFIAPFVEANFYGRHTPALGAGLSLGYGDRSVIGISGMFASSFFDTKKISLLEITLTLRFFVFKELFLQLNGGLVLLYANNSFYFPADAGSFSIGLSAGWRFNLGKRFYIEPYLRGGYPYYGGLGASFGAKF